MIPITEIYGLLGYVETDIENGVQMKVSDWKVIIKRVREWLDMQRSLTTHEADTGQDGALCSNCNNRLSPNWHYCPECGEIYPAPS